MLNIPPGNSEGIMMQGPQLMSPSTNGAYSHQGARSRAPVYHSGFDRHYSVALYTGDRNLAAVRHGSLTAVRIEQVIPV